MRFAPLALAALAMSTPAHAATIVQVANSVVFLGFSRFDPALGRLDSATFDITVNSKRSFFAITNQPQGTTFPALVDWVVDGVVNINLPIAGQGYQDSLVPIYGSGSAMVPYLGYLDTYGLGSASFDIDTSLVQFDPVSGYSPLTWRPYAYGLGDPSLDTTFTMVHPVNLVSADNCEGGGTRGNEACTQARMTLTYSYTPVPEPSAWAMMLVGFGLAGAALRSRPSLQRRGRGRMMPSGA